MSNLDDTYYDDAEGVLDNPNDTILVSQGD